MKHYVDFFSIKVTLIAVIIIVLPVVFIITLTGVLGEDFDDHTLSVEFENAPENTAYVDILVRLPEGSSDYVEFNKRHVSVPRDSEIARLNDDGYVSLPIHYSGFMDFSETGQLLLNDDIITVSKRYGRFKAAYVDSSGNVLMITKTSRTRYAPKEPSGFALNGGKLTFTKSSPSPLQLILLIISLLGEPLAVIALTVCVVLDKLKNKHCLKDSDILFGHGEDIEK